MKFKTKGLTMAAVSVLAMGAMVSTGFATWVITGNSTGSDQASIGVDAQVKYVDIKELDTDKDLNLYFGPNADNSTGWLQSTVGTATDLEAQVSFEVKGVAGGTVKVTALSFTETPVTIGSAENQTPYAAAVTAGLVCELPSWVSSAPANDAASYMSLDVNGTSYLDAVDDTFTLSNLTPGVATLTFKLKLNWGTAFGGNNPLDYYNSHSQDSEVTSGVTYGQDALAKLTGEAFANLSHARFALSFTLESVLS